MAHPNKVSLVAVWMASFLLMRGCSLVMLEERDYTHTCQAIQREHDQWFLYTYESRFDGCTLSCVFLLSSTFRYRDYFDKTMTHSHYFHSDKGCIDGDHVSSKLVGLKANIVGDYSFVSVDVVKRSSQMCRPLPLYSFPHNTAPLLSRSKTALLNETMDEAKRIRTSSSSMVGRSTLPKFREIHTTQFLERSSLFKTSTLMKTSLSQCTTTTRFAMITSALSSFLRNKFCSQEETVSLSSTHLDRTRTTSGSNYSGKINECLYT